MKDYLHWSRRQFYLLVFLPTQFQREIEEYRGGGRKLGYKERWYYLQKMLPWTIVLAILGNFIAGCTCQLIGINFKWVYSWGGVAAGVLGGVLVGVSIGVALGVAGIVAFGVLTGVLGGVLGGVAGIVAFGVAGIVLVGVAFGVANGVTFGVAIGVAGGLGVGLAFPVTAGVALGVLVGLAFGVLLGVAFGVAAGMAFGVAFALAFWLTYYRLVTYPFHAALTALTYFAGLRKPSAVLRVWRWCPVAWDEVIWLPLPFVSKLLALLVRQDRSEGFQQIAFVAAERRLQRRAARAALVEVAIDDLKAKSPTELASVAEKLEWTTDAPAELPPEVTTALLRFDRTAQHAGQFFTLQSPYRRIEALDLALVEMAGLQRSLIAAKGRIAPRLLKVANEWRALLENELVAMRAGKPVTQEIPNPFIFGNPVTERQSNVFAGRQDIVRQIEESLLGARQIPTLLLHGPRRMGKTSILNQLPRLLGPDFAPALVDCQNPAVTESEPSLLRYLSRALSSGLRQRRVALEPLSREALTSEPFAVFDDWLDTLERALPDNIRSLLCLDEYENLQGILDTGWGARFLDTLRHTLQHRPRVALMFTGAHTFEELGPAWTSRFVSARRVRVGFLPREDLVTLLSNPIPEFDMTYAPGALDAILGATNGQPFLTQAVAFELVQYLNEKQRKEATCEDITEAIGRALGSGSEYFANVWFDARAEGQAILLALARGEAPPGFPEALRWLRHHDVLNDAGSFAVPMVEQWIKKEKL